jgi:uncharacterized membrane protein YdjX (TVP38/TMEM64 family)
MIVRYKWRLLILVSIIAFFLFLRFMGVSDFLTIIWFNEHKEQLLAWIDAHYMKAVLAYCSLYTMVTLTCLPIVGILTVVGGFLFGAIPAALYVNVGATAGATILFLLVRYLIGEWIQEKYATTLVPINQAIRKRGTIYLITVHFIVVIPFALITILLGLTRITLLKFIWTTSVGIFPGSLVYAFAGQQLSSITQLSDIFSSRIIFACLLLTFLACLPALYERYKYSIKRS